MGGLIDQGAVLAWGSSRIRDLPWRRERDPWRILVAEVMLQQTQADRVIPKWQAFLHVFPTPAACAAASLAEVLRLWQGLGYPRRARNLQRAAAVIVEQHGGAVPTDLDALLELPGVGPYTARAVSAFAFEHDVGVVDTNIARVLARAGGVRLTPRAAQRAADDLVPVGQGWFWNQVLMDVGATLCRPVPRCASCPIADGCAWHMGDHPVPDPATGSAGVSNTQARFEGSDRQARGAVLRALHDGPVPVAGFDARIVAGLVDDGLVEIDGSTVRLPM
ncbi:MAG: A/G-specific adenine glycosylase [Ilumatobacteraceae bacterium]